MKKNLLVVFLSMFSVSVFAQVPQELQELLPVGQNSIRILGKTEKNESCMLDMSIAVYGFGATLYVMDKDDVLYHKRLGKFTVGLGHELQDIKKQDDTTIAVSYHNAEEQYSSDTRHILKVSKTDGVISSAQIIVQKKIFFLFKTVVNETCFFKVKN